MEWSWRGKMFFRLLGGKRWTEKHFRVVLWSSEDEDRSYLCVRRNEAGVHISSLLYETSRPEGGVGGGGGHNPTAESRFLILWWCSHFGIICVRNRNWQCCIFRRNYLSCVRRKDSKNSNSVDFDKRRNTYYIFDFYPVACVLRGSSCQVLCSVIFK
jgi:hypothetical protein